MTQRVSLTVNGRPIEAAVEPRTHLADFLRDTFRLTGTHLGCEHGVCGACTLLVDGAPVRGCIAYAVACDGADVRTVEAFDDDPLMHALREAFTRHHALQCGYCTPGMLITAYDIVRRLPGADEARVREELSGNLCRCTGYVGIVEAVRSVLADPPLPADGPTGAVTDSAHAPRGNDDRTAAPEPHSSPPPGGSDSVAVDNRQHTATGAEAPDATTRPPRMPARVGAPSPAPHGFADTPGAQDESRAESPRVSPGTPDASPGTRRGHASAMPQTTGSEHEITLATAPDTLWPVLRDIAVVVRCLPGASLNGPASADPLSVGMTVAIGPMRARFDGTARVVFDDRRRTATIEGSGHDARSRTTSEGRIELSVRPSPDGGAILALRLRYALKGPLAQFSRGALVDAVVEQLLGRFADNLSSVAEGKEVGAAPIGGLGLTLAALRERLRRWMTGGRR